MSSNNEVKGKNILEADLTTNPPSKGDRIHFNGTEWVPITRSYVHAYASLNPSLTSGTTQTFNFMYNTTLVDINGDFNTGTGQFTAPRNGIYAVTIAYELQVSTPPAIFTFDIGITANGRSVRNRLVQSAGSSFTNSNVLSTPVQLLAGQSISMTVFQNTGATQVILGGSNKTFFIIAET